MKPDLPSPLRWWRGHWLRTYRAAHLPGDTAAAVVTTLLLLPQSVAYALLAGLPPQMGLYAGIFPPLAYALFGSSSTLAVGPMAVTSLMIAAALAPLAAVGSPEYLHGAMWLALIGGIGLFIGGLFRFGFLAQLLSRPVLSGFTTAAALMIAWSQLSPLLGFQFEGLHSHWHTPTATVGLLTLAVLALAQYRLAAWLGRCGLHKELAQWVARLMPALIIVAATVITAAGRLDSEAGIAVVGTLPEGLPAFALAFIGADRIGALLVPALMIALVSFVSSVSIAQTLAAVRNERISGDAELRGLGAANIAAGVMGGFPVNGGLSRSAVNFAAGARTPLAGVFTAGLMLMVTLGGGELFRFVPVSALAATIIMALLGLIDVKTLRQAWRYDRTDAYAWLLTAAGVLAFGVVEGIVLGMATSVVSLVWRSSHPHIAVLGWLPGTEQFRNILRYKTQQLANVLFCRIDENLFFGNIQAIDNRLREELEQHPETRHLVLVMLSVSQIDLTAVQMLERLNRELQLRDITLHLAELKGPVQDRLQETDFLRQLTGRVFISTFAAYRALDAAATTDYAI